MTPAIRMAEQRKRRKREGLSEVRLWLSPRSALQLSYLMGLWEMGKHDAAEKIINTAYYRAEPAQAYDSSSVVISRSEMNQTT